MASRVRKDDSVTLAAVIAVRYFYKLPSFLSGYKGKTVATCFAGNVEILQYLGADDVMDCVTETTLKE